MSNPFGQPLPALVMLRNRQFAVVESFVEVGKFEMQGRGPFLTSGARVGKTEADLRAVLGELVYIVQETDPSHGPHMEQRDIICLP